MDFILTPDRASLTDPEAIGGKAWNLARLTSRGYPVPDWIVVTGEAWKRFGFRPDETHTAAEILDLRLPTEIEEPIASWMDGQDGCVAVRSSVSVEDSDRFSHAGMMESFLYQRTLEDVLESLRKCWASAFSERAVQYRRQSGQNAWDVIPSVIIQRMIDAEVSGVLFTAHPVTGSRRNALISAAYGLGEGLVSGEVNADDYVVDVGTQSIERTLRTKDVRLVRQRESGRGLVAEPVPADLAEAPCLTDDQVREIAALGRSVAKEYGRPLDVEWALAGGKFYLLQARPITTLPMAVDGERIVWDNSNIQESYCGVTTPLTFGFASRAYAMVYEQTMRLVRIPEKEIQRHADMLHHLLGLIGGRVYYHINNWYRGLLLLPSFQNNKADMERMMGLEEPVDFVVTPDRTWTQRIRKAMLVLRTAFFLAREFTKLPSSVDRFSRHFENFERRFRQHRLHELSLAQLTRLLSDIEEELLKKWQTPIVNDFFVMMQNGRVRRWLESCGVENPDLMQNQLLAGEPDLESSMPTKRLAVMADAVRREPAVKELFAAYAPEQLHEALRTRHEPFFRQCEEYIRLYGDRVMGELKLETVTLRQDPSFLYLVLKNYLADPDMGAAQYVSQESALRASAEADVMRRASRRLLGKWRLGRVVRKWRAGVRHRESMRLRRTRMFGMVRDVFLAVGQTMVLSGRLEEARDIFYLTIDEVDAWMSGGLVESDFRAIVRRRKEEYAEYEKRDLPNRIETIGPVDRAMPFPDTHVIDRTQTTFQGLGCYPGVVEGVVRKIFSPRDAVDLQGQILLTLRTDPGWTPLFPSCRGIIVERGSSLSHSAVIARELGIPTIVAVPHITRSLETGDRVRMDGGAGVIQKLEAV